MDWASRSRLRPYLTVLAVTVSGTEAPPLILIPDFLHSQIPTECRFKVSLPVYGLVYRLCWLTSIRLMSFRREAPYRVPYLPTIPTFLVRLAIFGGKKVKISTSFCKFDLRL